MNTRPPTVPKTPAPSRRPARAPFIEPLEARIAPAFAAVIDLAGLNGLTGFKMNGAQSSGFPDFLGFDGGEAGDVNGDGLEDFVISAPNRVTGEIYVVFGKATGFSSTLNLEALNGTEGFQINGVTEGEFAGGSVHTAGDFNGDGFDDLIIGARNALPAGQASGAAYVVFGKATFAGQVNLASLDGTNGFRVPALTDRDLLGASVSGSQDVNYDGFDDVIIGAPNAGDSAPEAGAAYVIFGRASAMPASFNLASLNGSNGFKISGEMPRDSFGHAVSVIPSVNGDQFSDLLIGAPGFTVNGRTAGTAYIVYGKAGGFSTSVNVSTLTSTTGFQINAEAESLQLGLAVAGAKINGDQTTDILLGSGGSRSYAVFGPGFASAPGEINLANLNGSNGFAMFASDGIDTAGGNTGVDVSGAGDVNGDGIEDFLVGGLYVPSVTTLAPGYLVFGKATGFAATLDLTLLNGSNGMRLTVPDQNVSYVSVNAAGDVNADGFADVFVGTASTPQESYTGQGYVLFGGPSAPSVNATLVNATTATFTDVDGDLVTVKVTKGSLSQADFTLVREGAGARLVKIDFSDDGSEFQGAGLTVTVTKRGGGDGFVNVGYINAAGRDLGAVNVVGDLGHIIAGDANTATAALTSLTVQSLGHETFDDLPTGASFSAITSVLLGPVPNILVKGNVFGAFVNVIGGANGDLGKVQINHQIWIRQELDVDFSGTFKASGDISQFEVKSSIQNGNGNFAASIIAGGAMGQIMANGSLQGGVIIGGTYQSGFGPHHGILAGKTISKVRVGGELRTQTISAVGNLLPANPTAALAIGNVSVGLSAFRADILAGYDALGRAVNPDAAINLVLVGDNPPFANQTRYGTWTEGNIVAGIARGGDGLFGTADDMRIPGGNSQIAKIASITLKGQVRGTTDGVDHFGFVAEKIAALKIGTLTYALTSGADNFALGTTGDFRLRDFV